MGVFMSKFKLSLLGAAFILSGVLVSVNFTLANADQEYSRWPQSMVSPDLSYDAFAFQVGEITPESLKGNCETIKEDLVGFKKLNEQNYNSILTYVRGVSGVVEKWENQLEIYAGKKLNFSPSTFAPVRDLAENMVEAAKLIEANSIMVDDYAYEFSELLMGCLEDQEISSGFEQYSVDLFSTQSEVWRYIADSSIILNDLYERFLKYEGQVPVELEAHEFARLEKIWSHETGSSGFGEVGILYELVMSTFYKNRYIKIEKQINEALDVKSSRIH